MYAITGFIDPNYGEVYINGSRLSSLPNYISIVWQKPYLFQGTVFENIAYGLKVRKVGKLKIKERVIEILKLFNIENIKDQKTNSLSGGESAKVAIARAVATSPQILILDEPTASLDPQSVLDIEKLILNLKMKFNITIIIVTHNMFQAKRIADEILFFADGRLIESGTTSKIFSSPKYDLTKKFISDESLFY